jgi:nitroreductase
MHNAVLDCIRSRRSIRRFKPEQIRDEELAAILEAAAWAPSGGNSQVWQFTAIQNAEFLGRLNETLRTTFLVWQPDDEYPSKRKAKVNAQNVNHNYFYHAPTLVVFSNLPGCYPNAMADCACATENLFLAAHSLGLGTCWINQPRWLRDEPAVRDLLAVAGVPREHVICSAAAVGYPDQDPKAPKRREGTSVIFR